MQTFKKIKKNINNFTQKYKYLMMPLVLIGGFIADWLTLNRIDQVFDNMIFIIHLIISGSAIAFLHATDTQRLQEHPRRDKYRSWATGLMLFSFGALYSGFFIFYVRSASFVTSWFVVMGLLTIMLSTEWKRNFYLHRTVQIGIYYLALLCYLIFLVPIILDKIGAGIFILSTLVSLVVGIGFVRLLRYLDAEAVAVRRPGIVVALLGTAVIMNLLYFLNIIPPIPLSLQHKAPYLSLEKVEDAKGVSYNLSYEEKPLLQRKSRNISWQAGNRVYVFTSIFAPTNIQTKIKHCWEYFDPQTKKWVVQTCIPIRIAGGNDWGYRNYSYKENLWEGRWRVRFLTERNQVLSILRFRIVEREVNPEKLKTEVR